MECLISRRVSCDIKLRGRWHFMAEFERRSSQNPLQSGGFYSFIEDYKRSPGDHGYRIVGSPEFYLVVLGT